MAKFWEVIQAFQEGRSTKAVRSLNGRIKAVKEKNGVVFYDSKDEPFQVQSISDDDLTLDWEIIELPHLKKFDFMLVVAEMTTTDEDPHSWVEHELFNGFSFEAAFERLKSDYAGSEVRILSAVGSDEKGSVTVLALEGSMGNE